MRNCAWLNQSWALLTKIFLRLRVNIWYLTCTKRQAFIWIKWKPPIHNCLSSTTSSLWRNMWNDSLVMDINLMFFLPTLELTMAWFHNKLPTTTRWCFNAIIWQLTVARTTLLFKILTSRWLPQNMPFVQLSTMWLPHLPIELPHCSQVKAKPNHKSLRILLKRNICWALSVSKRWKSSYMCSCFRSVRKTNFRKRSQHTTQRCLILQLVVKLLQNLWKRM